MTQIDWSQAPEWAGVFLKHVTDDSYVWAASYKDEAQASHVSGRYVCFWLNTPCWVVVESRPEPQWSGEGLPPVGVECEYQRNDVIYKQAWVAVTPRYIGEPVTVLKHSASGNEFTEMTASCVFRPIRTPEQIAAEEREKELDFMARCIAHSNKRHNPTENDMQAACHLYYVGYRKPNA